MSKLEDEHPWIAALTFQQKKEFLVDLLSMLLMKEKLEKFIHQFKDLFTNDKGDE